MPITITILGSIFGLAAAVGSLMILNVSFLVALAIWSVSGIAATLLALSAAMAPAQQDSVPVSPKIA